GRRGPRAHAASRRRRSPSPTGRRGDRARPGHGDGGCRVTSASLARRRTLSRRRRAWQDDALMHVLVHGAGAVGGYFGALLARGGHDVTFVARGANLAALRSDG